MVLNAAPVPAPDARTSAASAFTELCRWAAGAMALPLPSEVRRRAALVLIDDIGAAVAASAEPEVVAVRSIELAGARGRAATVFCSNASRADRVSAAVANGMAACWAELDEGYRLMPCHAGAYIWPALTAEAEATGASVEATLRALALAYEMTARIARAFPFPAMTVHPHAAFATIGAAAGVALLRRSSAQVLMGAVAGAASMTFAGPYGHAIDGALIRNGWTAAGAWIGFRSVDWAEAGISGIAQSLHDVFVTSLGTASAPEELSRDLGGSYAIADGYHKIFACCQYAHSMIEAALDLHRQLGAGTGERVAAIEIETHPRGLTLTAVDPATVLSAKFSMPHAAAAVARLGTGGQAAFSRAALVDPDIAELRRKVTLKPLAVVEPWPNDRGCRLTWIMTDGTRHTASCSNARGGADQPFDEVTLLAKLDENAGTVFPAMPGVFARLLDPRSDATTWRAIVQTATGSSHEL